ncbi:MAG: chemotaxis protein CheC [Ruminococcus sp.]|nr:chemotaxis protein CheC [Ruminococcus sp.]
MAIIKIDDLSSMHLDVLKEIGNIGSGNAATSLSEMLGIMVDISVPNVKLLGFDEAVQFLGGPEQIAIGMLVRLTGDISGMMLYVIQEAFAANLAKAIMGKENLSIMALDEMDTSLISEVGNIMSASYVNAISSLSGMFIDISVPSLCVDMVGAILSVPAIEFSKIGDKVLFIDDSFIMGDNEVRSNMILVPELDSLNKLFSVLGIQ